MLVSILIFLDNIPIFFTSYSIDALTLLYDEKDIANFNNHLKKNIGKGKNYDRSFDSRLEIIKAYYYNNMLFVLVAGILIKAFLFVIAIIGVLGISTMLFNKKNSNYRVVGLFFALLGGYLILLSCLTVQARFRLPLMPLWSVGSAYFFIMFWVQFKSIIIRRSNAF